MHSQQSPGALNQKGLNIESDKETVEARAARNGSGS